MPLTIRVLEVSESKISVLPRWTIIYTVNDGPVVEIRTDDDDPFEFICDWIYEFTLATIEIVYKGEAYLYCPDGKPISERNTHDVNV